MSAAFPLALLLAAAPPAEVVTYATDAGPATLTGRAVVEGGDGGVLLETPDGALHAIAAARINERTPAGEPFVPLTGAELGASLAADLDSGTTGPGAAVTVTPHFAIASTASPAFTEWAGELLEAVHEGFVAEFAPTRPLGGSLPVVILRDRAAFEAFAARPDQAARGVNPALSQGYYDPASNRIVLYDFSATPGSPSPLGGARRSTLRERVANRQANVATVAHEAVHQLAYNMGLHTRLAHYPVWLTEGLAMQAEATDRRAPLSWKGFADGANPARSKAWRAALAARRRDRRLRNVNPLPALIGGDGVFSDPTVAAAAYAASWALVRHLRADRPEAFRAYLSDLAARPPLVPIAEEERATTFRTHFGDDLDGLWNDLRRVR